MGGDEQKFEVVYSDSFDVGLAIRLSSGGNPVEVMAPIFGHGVRYYGGVDRVKWHFLNKQMSIEEWRQDGYNLYLKIIMEKPDFEAISDRGDGFMVEMLKSKSFWIKVLIFCIVVWGIYQVCTIFWPDFVSEVLSFFGLGSGALFSASKYKVLKDRDSKETEKDFEDLKNKSESIKESKKEIDSLNSDIKKEIEDTQISVQKEKENLESNKQSIESSDMSVEEAENFLRSRLS